METTSCSNFILRKLSSSYPSTLDVDIYKTAQRIKAKLGSSISKHQSPLFNGSCYLSKLFTFAFVGINFFNWLLERWFRCLALLPQTLVMQQQDDESDELSFLPLTGCRRLNSRITSSNDNNCSSITITIITKRAIIRICSVLSDQFLPHGRSPRIQWHSTTRLCINRTPSFSRPMASTWTCISPSAVPAICLTEQTAAVSTSSMEQAEPTTRCCSRPANAPRSWINNRITGKSRRSSSPTLSRRWWLRSRASAQRTEMQMAQSAPRHRTALISKRNSKTASYWMEWIPSTTTTPIRPINICWSPIKRLAADGKTTKDDLPITCFMNWLRKSFLIRKLYLLSFYLFSSLDFMSVIFYTTRFCYAIPRKVFCTWELYFYMSNSNLKLGANKSGP